jgi:hypothetical protein
MTKLTVLTCAVVLLLGAAETTKPPTSPLRWLGVEVVTNDFDLVERVRRAAAIEPGTVMPITDSKLKQACDTIRRELPSASIRCSPNVSAKVDGLAEALYIVEINVVDRPPLAPPHCNSAATLSPELALLVDQWESTVLRTMVDGDLNTERVNAGKYLDYDSAERHALVERMHATVKSKIADLEAASSSCSNEHRTDALYLMNFTGDPQRAISSATQRLDDPDSGVRNAAMRLLGTFATFLPQSQVFSIAKTACQNTIRGDFTDRNKSLLLLNELAHRGALRFADLDEKCQAQIRNIARTSFATQTGMQARELAGSATRR